MKTGQHQTTYSKCWTQQDSGSKLKESQVLDIRKLCSEGYSNKQIAGLYAVTPENISNIKNRRTWKWL